MKPATKASPIILPDKISPALGMDGRHHAVPLMAEDKRFGTESDEQHHPRLGSISHGWGHLTQVQAEALAKEVAHRYNCYGDLIKALQDIHVIAADAQLRATYQRTALEQISAKVQALLIEV